MLIRLQQENLEVAMSIVRTLKNNALWVFYFFIRGYRGTHSWGRAHIFSCRALRFSQSDCMGITRDFHALQPVLLKKRHFFKTMRSLLPYYWFRQASYDLYIGVFMTLCLIYSNEGCLLVAALWFVPVLVMANLATLLYVAFNDQSLVTHFV